MSGKDDSPDWAGKGFNRRNEESAPEPKQPKLKVVPRGTPAPPHDDDDWIWE